MHNSSNENRPEESVHQYLLRTQIELVEMASVRGVEEFGHAETAVVLIDLRDAGGREALLRLTRPEKHTKNNLYV